MVLTKVCILMVIITVASASPLEEARALCASADVTACLKYKLLSFFQTDNFKLSDDIKIVSNGYQPITEARGTQSFGDIIQEYIQTHDVTFNLPLNNAVSVSARDLDNDTLTFKLKFSSSDIDEGRGKKKKLKKILIPIVVLLLLKALTLKPLILGILGIKTWNALQLSFITFLTSFGFAIYELLKKFASDHPPATIVTHTAHDHWDPHHRSFNEDSQQMAYNAYY